MSFLSRLRCAPAVLAAAAAVALAAPPADAAVFVVRHAEKQTEENGREVPLSAAGRARAERLAEELRDARIVAIYSTDMVRTLATAEPLAHLVHVKAILYDPAPDGMKALAGRIRKEHPSDNVLVVGHSNTIGPLIEALGVRDAVEVGGSEYDGLWVVVPSGRGRAPVLLRLRQ